MDIMHRLQKSTGTGDQDADYHLTTDGLVRFRDMIYVPNCSELTKLILREFHMKPYSGHPGYHKTSTIVNSLYYWPNLKKEVVEILARCLDYQQVTIECNHLVGLLQPIAILEWKW